MPVPTWLILTLAAVILVLGAAVPALVASRRNRATTVEPSIESSRARLLRPAAASMDLDPLGLVVAVVAAGFLIRLATRRAEARSQRNDDEQGRREALSLLLAGTAGRLLHARATPADLPALARFGGRQRELMDTIDKAPPAQFDAVQKQIEQFHGQMATVTGRSGGAPST